MLIYLVLFNDNEMAQEILSTDDPREHKALGRKVSNFDQAIWNDKCQSLVKQGNLAKVGERYVVCNILIHIQTEVWHNNTHANRRRYITRGVSKCMYTYACQSELILT